MSGKLTVFYKANEADALPQGLWNRMRGRRMENLGSRRGFCKESVKRLIQSYAAHSVRARFSLPQRIYLAKARRWLRGMRDTKCHTHIFARSDTHFGEVNLGLCAAHNPHGSLHRLY